MADTEWLVTDQFGAFAMGTARGIRTRKYHGFFAGIPGRAETQFLAELEIFFNGRSLWPHAYAGALHPNPDALAAEHGFVFTSNPHPLWQWRLPEGSLKFSIEAGIQGGIRLGLEWSPKRAAVDQPVRLELRPFFAMRGLHRIGGQSWAWENSSPESAGRSLSVISDAESHEVFVAVEDGWNWSAQEVWHQNFFYTEEQARGYDCREDLFSAGSWQAEVRGTRSLGIVLGQTATQAQEFAPNRSPRRRSAASDFVLHEPAGIVAGFPWFGEWGRDSFIALPGIVLSRLRDGDSPNEVLVWAQEILGRWGSWIREKGMLPNLVDREGTHQWESADATLWWTHALASLWQASLGEHSFLTLLKHDFAPVLGEAIRAIEDGRHLFLRVAENGLLEVTEPHTTWMDARVDGHAVTPRVGALPEINALWVQARALCAIWQPELGTAAGLAGLARAALGCVEPGRPNRVFLHSLPLGPSFVLQTLGDPAGEAALADDLRFMVDELWTPVGLRSLSPRQSGYVAQCVGDQPTRDRAYHQGPVWGWLGGHFEMARARLRVKSAVGAAGGAGPVSQPGETFPREQVDTFPIHGHFPEIFDAEAPFTPRGAPAQAWSIACFEEAGYRKRSRLDSKLAARLETAIQSAPALSSGDADPRASEGADPHSPDAPAARGLRRLRAGRASRAKRAPKVRN